MADRDNAGLCATPGNTAQVTKVTRVQVAPTAGVGVPPGRLAEVVLKQAQRARLAAGRAAVD